MGATTATAVRAEVVGGDASSDRKRGRKASRGSRSFAGSTSPSSSTKPTRRRTFSRSSLTASSGTRIFDTATVAQELERIPAVKLRGRKARRQSVRNSTKLVPPPAPWRGLRRLQHLASSIAPAPSSAGWLAAAPSRGLLAQTVCGARTV